MGEINDKNTHFQTCSDFGPQCEKHGNVTTMIVKDTDSARRKWKYWFLTVFLSFLTFVACLFPAWLLLCYLPMGTGRILGAVLILAMIYVAGKIVCAIENHIGISVILQNPNRDKLVKWPPDWYPPWMKKAKRLDESSRCDTRVESKTRKNNRKKREHNN